MAGLQQTTAVENFRILFMKTGLTFPHSISRPQIFTTKGFGAGSLHFPLLVFWNLQSLRAVDLSLFIICTVLPQNNESQYDRVRVLRTWSCVQWLGAARQVSGKFFLKHAADEYEKLHVDTS